jgi:Nitroreductase family
MEMHMALSRRTIVFAAGSAALALAGSGGLFAVTRTPTRAIAPWDAINGTPPADVRLDAFRHAILAPNPHNRQPWQIRLVGRDEALIYCDLDRRLPETDPFDRQILIGFGCFLELARIAAAERGFAMEIKPFPDGVPGERLDRRAIASLRFTQPPIIAKDPLFAAIAIRRTNKRPYDTARPVGQGVLDGLAGHRTPQVQIMASRNEALIRSLREATWDAWMVEHETSRTWMETVNLMRIGKSEIEANPDGVSIGGPMLEAMALVGQISRQTMGQPGTTAYKTGIDRYRPIMATAMAYAWIATNGNSRIDQLGAGRAYVRMNLDAAAQGLGFHPASQALQEFPEMAKSFAAVHAILGAQNGLRVQMLMRLGYGTPIDRTPRWPLESKLMGA